MLSAKAFAGRFCRLFFWRFRLWERQAEKPWKPDQKKRRNVPCSAAATSMFLHRERQDRLSGCATRLDENFQGGYTPQQIRSAYDFPANSTGLGQTIALITTGLQPNIESDLSFFSSFFSLPAARLTIRRIGAVPEVLDSDWALETTLDVEWAHALAPEADLLLVYAASDRIGDLMQAARSGGGLGRGCDIHELGRAGAPRPIGAGTCFSPISIDSICRLCWRSVCRSVFSLHFRVGSFRRRHQSGFV